LLAAKKAGKKETRKLSINIRKEVRLI